MSDTMFYTGTLEVMKCWCGTRHAVPQEMRDHQMRAFNEGRDVPAIYCPHGHTHVPSGKSRTKELEEQLQRERQRRDQAEAAAIENARKANEANKKLARVNRRVGNGVCPCCNRTFANLARHMKCKHPEVGK